jgi:hypothetical protein
MPFDRILARPWWQETFACYCVAARSSIHIAIAARFRIRIVFVAFHRFTAHPEMLLTM